MGVTIPALLAARSGCPAFTMAGGRPQPKRSFSIIPCFVFVESVLLGIVVLLAYRLEFTDTFPVHTQGFFCYDSTYAKPYPGPEAASRVPPALIYALVTAGPTLTILLGELARAFSPAPPSAIPIIGESTIVSGACCRFSPPLRRLVRFLGVYSFGLFTTTIFANAGQVVTGNPTPHFLSVCRPNYTALGCPPPSPDRPGPDRFVTDQGACAGSPSLVAAARRAFPCKDAALCAYAVTYTAMYVTLVFRVKGSRLVKPSLCLALLCPAFLVGVVRVAEYRNHWSDVLAGFLTGAAIATFLVTCVVHNFQSRRPSGRRLSPWEDLGQAPTMDSPLEKLSVAQPLPSASLSQEPEACRPHSTPARLTPSKSQNCARRGHLIPSCVSSRAPAMCSSPRVPRPRLRISRMGGYDSSQWGTANAQARAKERRKMGSSFVIESSLQVRESSWSMGAGSPMAGSLGHPFLSQLLPHVQPLAQSLPTPNLYRACPSSEVLGFRVLCLPLSVPRLPQTLLLLGLWEGTFFFCLGISPCSLHCPHPGPQPRADVPPCGGGMGGAERTPLLQAAKGSGQRRHCPPFLPHP
eukprot:XP_022262731.1 phospholipid phosphatase-related protein type 2 isoform X1 [Canis lupus familiaris]